MDEKLCIICRNKLLQGSEEHIFPDSIGGKLTIFDVCKQCNDVLGSSVDTHLVNNKLIQLHESIS